MYFIGSRRLSRMNLEGQELDLVYINQTKAKSLTASHHESVFLALVAPKGLETPALS